MTQQELVIEYLRQHGVIVPAKMSGKIFMGHMFGSEISRACRYLRKKGKVESKPNGKFEEFRLVEPTIGQVAAQTIKPITDMFSGLQKEEKSKHNDPA